jgi:hypothetical protein
MFFWKYGIVPFSSVEKETSSRCASSTNERKHMVANVTQVCQLENMAYSDVIHRMCVWWNNKLHYVFASVTSQRLNWMIGDQINSSTMSNYFNKRLICLVILVFRTVVFVTSSPVTNEGYVQINQTGRTTGALDFIVYVCSSLNNCEPLATGLVVDNNWRGVFYNLCYDPKRCDKVLYHDFVFTLILNITYVV